MSATPLASGSKRMVSTVASVFAGAPLPRQAPPQHSYIDALRGWAIVMVVLVHCVQAVPPAHPLLLALAPAGERGVQLFFVASALTLSMSWQARGPQGPHPWRMFFIRRLFRIAPMFWLATAFYLWLYGTEPRYWAPEGLSVTTIVLTCLFLNGVAPQAINALVPGGWSVAVEASFYLCFPLIKSVSHNLRHDLLLFGGSILLAWVAHGTLAQLLHTTVRPEHSYLVANFFI